MPLANTPPMHDSHHTLFTSFPCGKAKRWLERNVFKTSMSVSFVVLCMSISNASVTFKCRLNVIKDCTRCRNPSRTQIDITQKFQCENENYFRDILRIKRSEHMNYRLSFLICLVTYNRFAAPLSWLADRHICKRLLGKHYANNIT